MSQSDHSLSRRQFLADSCKVSAGVMAAGALASCASPKKTGAIPTLKPLGANDRINIAVVGARSRGWAITGDCMALPGIHLKAICDPDGNVLDRRAAEIEKKKGYKPDTYKDMRKMFEDPQIDAVLIGTPNHWHALATVWACQAGKHVFVEKPACHNVFEGRKMVEAARKYNRLVQVGFQNRSMRSVRKAMAFLHEGGIGDIYMARGLCYKPRDPIGICKDGIGTGPDYTYYAFNSKGENYTAEYMANVDYDKWTGPAPLQPFNYNRFHYNWHWNYLYGGGDIANQGPHQFDVARWGLNKQEHPTRISSFGTLMPIKSDQNTPHTQTASFEYADKVMFVFEVRGLYVNEEMGVGVGNFFYGSKGWMWINGTQWATFFGRKNEPGPTSDAKDEDTAADPMNVAGAGGGGHMGNFVAALRSGKVSDLTADIEQGYMSSALPALANISYRVGRTINFDGKNERIIDDSEADKLLTRNYRKPYVVPNVV